MDVKELITEGIDRSGAAGQWDSDPFWASLRRTGTELWLDTGDIDEAQKHWSTEMSALTTNNTLLNREIQKGIYDDYIKRAREVVGNHDRQTQIREIAFILNARHGLRLVERFGGKVSVELHTDFAHDYDATVYYARRFHEIAPNHFIIKVPFTAEGLVASRELHKLEIPVNMTLGFSARQNFLATTFAKPEYVNVFLGRINSYFADNGLGSGRNIGEKTTLASQRSVEEANGENGGRTRQIAASMRSAGQLPLLAGVDVFTMPLEVAAGAREELPADFASRRSEDYEVELHPEISPEEVRMECLYELTQKELDFIHKLTENPPINGKELAERARNGGCGDLFPGLDAEDLERIASEGKIPVHATWKSDIAEEKTAIDTLLNLAGLETFEKDQAELDHRIGALID
jgi:transaldolase